MNANLREVPGGFVFQISHKKADYPVEFFRRICYNYSEITLV